MGGDVSAGFVISQLCKRYRGFRLEIDELTIAPGECLGLVGENGAGKTTLFRSLMGLVKRDSGRVALNGRELPPDCPAVRRLLGYVPEESFFYEEQTVRWTLSFFRRFYPTWDDDLSASLLAWSRLDADRKVSELSRGMKRKLQLILALAFRPPVLLLDEPTAGLDMVARHEILELISTLTGPGESRCVLFSSHQPQDVEQLARRIAFVHQGRLLTVVDTEDCLRWQVISVPGDGVPPGVLEGLPGRVDACRKGRMQMVLSRSDRSDIEEYLKSCFPRGDWQIRSASVEAVFLCLTGRW